MKKILILGAGLVAGPLVRYLLDRPDFSVDLRDVEEDKAGRLIRSHPRGTAGALDIQDENRLRKEISRSDLVISMVPYVFHPRIAGICLELRKNMVTASYAGPEMKALDAEAGRAGVLLLNEMGLDPGIDHMEAMRIIHEAKTRGGRILAFTSYCGGLPAPEDNTNPFGYKFSWSPRGVLLASGNSARFLRDGEVVSLPAGEVFAHPETINIPGLGDFEAYANRDSLSYVETYGIPETRTMLRGTLRYDGWCRTLRKIGELGLLDRTSRRWSARNFGGFIRELMPGPGAPEIKDAVSRALALEPDSDIIRRLEWLGLFGGDPLPLAEGSPLDILVARMTEKMSYAEGERDMVVLRHTLDMSSPRGKAERVTTTLVDYGIPGGDSAMARTVGLPAAIGARLILEGKIARTGVHIPTSPDIFVPILNELKELGIRFVEKRVSL
ncbi:MAG TPA: saccharopine dehydrogenase C-terminal domain-containing protein [Candidatus Aminicenantes bacterium]|nr:saccharopine dehydrogenase C-terminal domain-containing protein [Candidatus Aminicenantes bacterium]